MRELITVAFALAFAFGVGIFTARSSAKREKIYGGRWSYVFHYVGASAFTGLLPGVLASVVLGVGHLLVLPIALSALGTTFVALVLFALVEHPARARALALKAERGWTEQDARASGL